MAISYPRLLPSFVEAVRCDMRLITVTSRTRTLGGAVVATELAPPFWSFEIETPALRLDNKAALKAWWDSLRGGLKTFLAYDMSQPIPLSYDSEAQVTALTRAVVGGAFDGTFEITTIDSSGTALKSVNAVALRAPASFALQAGDYISIIQSSRYSLHRIVNNVTSNANGNFSTAVNDDILIEPALSTTLFTAGATANVIKASAEFLPDQERFDAVQTLTETGAVIAGYSKVQA